MNTTEALDEDELRVDPLEAGVEPPEHYSAADRFGTTAAETREGESLERRLSEEEPDVSGDEVPETPLAIAPADQLDDSIDEIPPDVEPVAPDEHTYQRHSDPSPDEQADRAGGSVAESIRESG
ncbi:hypothetical protein [Amycolatopsis xylanica]|uniref:hypothetical protein n=1 Tax=Amycolatopsis xylanica TaxID=589385 RepID=UPI001FE0CA18|nr:hypothetical protein [Amycolatopsis xylanica]